METFTLLFWLMGGDPAALDNETYTLYRMSGLSARKCEWMAAKTKRHIEARCVRCVPDKVAWAQAFFPTHPVECSMGELGAAGLN